MMRSSFIVESKIGVTSHHVAEMSWFVRKIAGDPISMLATHGNIYQKYTTRKHAQNLNVVVRK